MKGGLGVETWSYRHAMTMRKAILGSAAAMAVLAAGAGGYMYVHANSAGQLAARAQLALSQNDPTKAQEYLKRAIEKHPSGETGMALRVLMARALMDAGREADARQYLHDVLAQKADHAEALDLLARSYVNPALRKLREAIKPLTDKSSKDIFQAADEGLADLEKLPAATRNLMAAAELHRLKYLVMKDLASQAGADVDAATIAQDQKAADEAHRHAEAIKGPAAQERDKAIEKLLAARKLEPKNTAPAALMAQYEYEDGHYDKVMALYEEMKGNLGGAESTAEDLVLAQVRSIIASRQDANRYHYAHQVLDAFVKGHPQSERAMVALGEVELNLGNVPQAEKDGAIAAAKSPGDLAAQLLLINCKLQEKKSDEALKLLTPLTTSQSGRPEVWYMLGLSAMDSGDSTGAENAFKKALAINPRYTAARQALLTLDLKNNDAPGAAAMAAQILRDDHYNMTAWEVTADRLRRQGLADHAREMLEALALEPALPMDARPALVRLLAMYGSSDAAAKLLATLPADEKDIVTLRAYVAAATGNSAQSRDLIAGALAKDPGDVDLRLKYVDLLSQAGLDADVRAQLEQIAGSKKELATEQSIEMARDYLALRQPDDATRVLKPVLDKEPDQGDARTLLQQANAMLNGDKGAKPVAMKELQNASKADIERAAAAALEARKYPEALTAARAGITKDKNDGILHQVAARALAGMGQTDQAMDELVEAARLQAESVGPYSAFVDIFSTSDAVMKGIGFGARLEAVSPALGNWAMGKLAQVAGDLDLAQRYYHKALDATSRMVDPRDAKDAIYQGILNARAQQKDAAGLKREAESLASNDAVFAPAIRVLAFDQLLTMGDRSSAQDVLESLTSRIGAQSRPALVLAVASRWLALGDGDRARLLMRKQVDANPNQPELLNAYATLLSQARDLDGAVKVREQMCGLDRGNPVYRVSLAEAQANAGDMPACLRTLDDASALGATGKEMAGAARLKLLISLGLLGEAQQELAARTADDPASKLELAQAWADLNKPDEARKLADDIPAYAAEYVPARLLITGMDLDGGRTDAAIAGLRDLMARQPASTVQAAPQLFIAYLRAGDAAAALDLATAQRDLYLVNSQRWQTWTAYAATAAREGAAKAGSNADPRKDSYEKAIALLNRLDPTARKGAALDVSLMRLLQGKNDDALKAEADLSDDGAAHNRTTVSLLAAPTPALVQQARGMLKDGLPSLVFAVMANLPPQDRASVLDAIAGNAHLFRGDIEALLQDMQSRPDAAGDLRRLALAQRLLEAGWSTNALAELEPIKDAGISFVSVQRHQALSEMHRFAEADAIRDQLAAEAKQKAPSPSVRVLLAAAWTKQEKYADALAMLEPLEVLKRTDILTTCATLHEKLGQLDPAIALHRQVRALDPAYFPAANNLAYTLVAAHPNDPAALAEAREAIEVAIAKRPDIGAFQETLGWIQILSGNPQEGTRTIARVLPLLRLEPAAHYHIGVGYARMGETDLARMHLLNVSRLAKDRAHVPELSLADEALRTLASNQ